MNKVDWVIVHRLVTGHPLGERRPTWEEGLCAVRELIQRERPINHVVQVMGLSWQRARAIVNEARVT